jgi:hypothetical protein
MHCLLSVNVQGMICCAPYIGLGSLNSFIKFNNNDDDHFPSSAPENITDTNRSIDSSSPITIMPELLVDVGNESTETDDIQTFLSQSILSSAEKGGTLVI